MELLDATPHDALNYTAATASLFKCLAVATATAAAALGFWRRFLANLSSSSKPAVAPLPLPAPPPSSQIDHSESEGKKPTTTTATREAEGEKAEPVLQTSTSQKIPFFEIYGCCSCGWYCEEGVDDEETTRGEEVVFSNNGGGEADGEEEGKWATEVARWLAAPAVARWSGEEEEEGEEAWHRCQDRTIINGNIVRLWTEPVRRQTRPVLR